MAYNAPGATIITLNAEAATDLSADGSRGLGIAVDAAGDAVAGAADGADFMGALLAGGRAAGDPVTIVAFGSALVQGAEPINEGDMLTVLAGGEFEQKDADAEIICGIAIAAGADEELFWALITHAQAGNALA